MVSGFSLKTEAQGTAAQHFPWTPGSPLCGHSASTGTFLVLLHLAVSELKVLSIFPYFPSPLEVVNEVNMYQRNAGQTFDVH